MRETVAYEAGQGQPVGSREECVPYPTNTSSRYVVQTPPLFPPLLSDTFGEVVALVCSRIIG